MSNPTNVYGDVTNSVLRQMRETIAKESLLENGDRVLVALSGGADSVCLLDALCKLKDELEIEVSAAHLNHMIRGAEADRDEAYAAELCTRLGVKFYAKRVNIPEISKRDDISEELAGRRERYSFFEEISDKYGCDKTATAHNRNDRAETVLMRIIRGTGIDGLCSIKYKRDDCIVRPLLDVSRDLIEEYCRENNLDFCTDSSNLSSDYTRNKIRNELIPFIEEGFNPKITDALCTLADNSAEDADFLAGYAERLYRRINSPMPRRKPIIVDISSLKMIGSGIQSRIIRLAAKDAMGKDYNLERVHIEAVRRLLGKETGASAVLPGGLTVTVKYGWLEYKLKTEEEETDFYCDIDAEDDFTNDLNISLRIVEGNLKPRKNQIILDYDLIEGRHLSIRNRKFGDRMVFFKDGRTRKLKDYWIDKKIPANMRNQIPLLCADDEIVAIIGDRAAENYKPNKNSKRGLLVEYGEDNENR